MTISATEIAAINENLKGIRDYAEKLEIMHDLQKKFFSGSTAKLISASITATNTKIDKQAGAIISVLKGMGKTITSMSKSADKMNDTLSKIFDAVKSGINISPESTAQISSVSTLTTPIQTQPIIAENQSAVIENITPLDVGGPEIAEALEKNAEIQEETNSLFKDFIKLEKDQVKQAETDALLGKKTKIDKDEKKQTVIQNIAPPAFPLSGKEFLSGLGTILKGILNPISIIAALIVKFLPFIILAIGFLKGFWAGIGDELREKLTTWGKRIALGAAIIFGLFKGVALIIKTLQLAFYTIKVSFVLAKWVLDINLWSLQVKNEAVKAGKENSFFLARMGRLITLFAMKVKEIIFERGLKVLEFLFTIAQWVIIIGLVVLLVGGIILIFSMFGDKILDATKKIMEVFMEVAKFLVTLPILLIDAAISAVVSLFRGLFRPEANTAATSAETENTKQEEQQKTENTAKTFADEMGKIFDKKLEAIITPLNAIKNAVQGMLLVSLSPGLTLAPAIRTIAATAIETTIKTIEPVTKNADSTDSIIDKNSYVSINSQAESNVNLKTLETGVDALSKTVQDIYKALSEKQFSTPRIR